MNLIQRMARFTLCILVGIGMSGCTKDYKINIRPDQKPSLVVNGLITAGEYPLLYITKTLPYYNDKVSDRDHDRGMVVEHAHVKMFLDGQLVDEQDLRRTSSEQFLLPFMGKAKVMANQVVRFEIAGEDLPTAIFEERMPIAPTIVGGKIDSIETTKNRFTQYNTMVKGQDHDFTYGDNSYNAEKPFINYIAHLQVIDHPFSQAGWTGVAIYNGNYEKSKHMGFDDFSAQRLNDRFKLVPMWTGKDPIFSKKCNDLMKLFNEKFIPGRSHDSIRIAYFSNNRLTNDHYDLTLEFPKLYVRPNYRFTVYAINYSYYKLAEDRYNEKKDDDDDDFSIDDSSGLIERKPTWSNIQHGTGIILLRSGSTFTWSTAP